MTINLVISLRTTNILKRINDAEKQSPFLNLSGSANHKYKLIEVLVRIEFWPKFHAMASVPCFRRSEQKKLFFLNSTSYQFFLTYFCIDLLKTVIIHIQYTTLVLDWPLRHLPLVLYKTKYFTFLHHSTLPWRIISSLKKYTTSML